jgi:hypothetical protein
MADGQGFRFDVDALYAYADGTAELAESVAMARSALAGAGQLPAGMFGEVGGSSGFLAAFAERAAAFDTALTGIGTGLDGLATSVRTYVDTAQRQDDDTAVDLNRAEQLA